MTLSPTREPPEESECRFDKRAVDFDNSYLNKLTCTCIIITQFILLYNYVHVCISM